MIDPTTLPTIQAGSLSVGQQYSIKGRNFNLWPDELVLSYRSDNFALNVALPAFQLMKLVSKSNTELVFEVTMNHDYTAVQKWNVFATPFGVPRTFLDYTTE